MRIAISGTHFSGKSTLIEALSRKLRGYESFDEPYFILEEDGHEFSYPPLVQDFEDQLQCCLTLVEKSPRNSIFDRSPIDFLAYAFLSEEDQLGDFDFDYWEPHVVQSLSEIDLLIFLPVENPDRIRIPKSEDPDFRLRVDEKLKAFILENSLGLLKKTKVFEVFGSLNERVKSVDALVKSMDSNNS